MTNSEKLRFMSDEELGQWLCDHMSCYGGGCPAHRKCRSIHNGMIKWLKQEVDDDKDKVIDNPMKSVKTPNVITTVR